MNVVCRLVIQSECVRSGKSKACIWITHLMSGVAPDSIQEDCRGISVGQKSIKITVEAAGDLQADIQVGDWARESCDGLRILETIQIAIWNGRAH